MSPSKDGLGLPDQNYVLLYGDWFVGFKEIPSCAAFVRTPPSGRPSFKPITRVGVFPAASSLSCCTSEGVQRLPALRVDFDTGLLLSVYGRTNAE